MDGNQQITSTQNPHFKRWISLRDSKGMTRHQQCLVSGEKIIHEILSHHPSLGHEFLYSAKIAHKQELPAHIKAYQLAGDLLRSLDTAGTSFPLLICHLKDCASTSLEAPPEGLEVLCPLGDPLNLGAVIRSCAAFGVQKLILLEEAAHPFHPRTIRSSSGAVFNIHIVQGPSIQALTCPDICQWIVAMNLTGQSLTTWQWPQDIRILVGEEGLGLPTGSFPATLTIPQCQNADSLNAAVATSIALYSYRQQFPLPNLE